MRRFRIPILILMVALALPFACKKTPPPPPPETAQPAETSAPAPVPAPVPFKVTALHLGRAIGADKKISDPATSFAPKDTIYASVDSEGAAASAELKARWTFGDKGIKVDESTQTIAPTGPAVTEFHIAKPSGWPAGKYKVEIWANGISAATQDFEVKK